MPSMAMTENAIWVASIFGPLMAILGLWMLLFSDSLIKAYSSFKNTPGAFYLNGSLNLLIGIAILVQYDHWSWDPFLLVTILGWALVLKGLLVLFIPQFIAKYAMTNKIELKFIGIFPLVWGLLLIWVAYLR